MKISTEAALALTVDSKSDPNFVSEPEEVDDNDDESSEKLKSAVHAFLEKNTKEPEVHEDEVDSISVEMDNETGEIISNKVHIIRGPDGSSKTIKTVEKIRTGEMETTGVGTVKIVKIEEMMNIQDVDEEDIPEQATFPVPKVLGEINNTDKDLTNLEGKTIDDLEKAVETAEDEFPDFSDLMDFLRPASASLQDLVLEEGHANPEALSELLSVPFSDLTRAFQVLFSGTRDLKQTYRAMFRGVKEEGAELFIARLLADNSRDVSESNGGDSESSGGVSESSDQLIARFVQSMGVGGKDIAQFLGSDKLNELVSEYVKNIKEDLARDPGRLTETVNKIIQDMAGKKRNRGSP